ncbi:MAG: hypothetical protein HZA35_01080 [Parcubacteria group bacterium]|nr:hypothetical protein [Parcubacteria group bacterium]
MFSIALFFTELPFIHHIGVLGMSYALFVIIASMSVYNMRHTIFVLILMFFLGETLFFLSYSIGVGLSLNYAFFVVKTISVHALVFIPLAFLNSHFLYEE